MKRLRELLSEINLSAMPESVERLNDVVRHVDLPPQHRGHVEDEGIGERTFAFSDSVEHVQFPFVTASSLIGESRNSTLCS